MKHQNHLTLLDRTKWADYFGFQVKETQFRIICKKLISFLIGPPGAGKSTTGLLMGKENGFSYFEADCIMIGCNPFVPLDAEHVAIAVMQQAPMKVGILV